MPAYALLVIKRRSSWACIGNPNPEQETIKATHNKRQPTNAGQHRYTSHKRQTPDQAAVKASASAQQCVMETSESRRWSWRTQRMSALSPAAVTGFDPATFEQLGSSEVGTPASMQ